MCENLISSRDCLLCFSEGWMYLMDIRMGGAAQGVKMAASIFVQSDLSPKKVLLSHKPHN